MQAYSLEVYIKIVLINANEKFTLTYQVGPDVRTKSDDDKVS